MALPMTMLAPVLLCIHFQGETKNAVLRWAPVVLLVFFIYGGFLQSSIEQHTMLHGRESTISFMDRVVSDLEANELLPSENEVVFVGNPAESPLFKKDDFWDLSINRCRYGDLPYGGENCVYSYEAVARDGGYDLPLEEDPDIWHEIAAMPEVSAMPAYPAEGYCRIIDGHLVVKLSN